MLVARANTEPRLTVWLRPLSSRRSDDYPFATHGVRAIHITTGEHVDYHRTGDTPARIDFAGLARVIDFAERLARDAADGPRRSS